jgi:hypothetical protein
VLLSIFTIPVLPAPFIISKVPVILLFHKEAVVLDEEVCIVLFVNVEDTLAVPVIVVFPLIPILPPLIFVAVFDVRPKVVVVAVPFPIVRVVALSILVDFTFPTRFIVGAVIVVEVVPVIGIVLPLTAVIPALLPNVVVVAVPVPKSRVVALSILVDFTFPTRFIVGAVIVVEVVPVIGIVLPFKAVIPALFPNVVVVAVPVPKLRVVALSMEVDFIPNASKLFVPVHTLLEVSNVVPALRDEDTYE